MRCLLRHKGCGGSEVVERALREGEGGILVFLALALVFWSGGWLNSFCFVSLWSLLLLKLSVMKMIHSFPTGLHDSIGYKKRGR